MSALIRVALVGDQALIRAGLARILCPSDGFAAVAECCLASRALEELADAGVDVALIDIGIPGLRGIDATARLCATPGAPAVLALSACGADEVSWGAIEAGAAGFLLKDGSAANLITAVRAVAGGGAWFDPPSRLPCSNATTGWWRPPSARRTASAGSRRANTPCCG